MTNLIVFNNLINGYNALSFTHNYIFGFTDRGNVYAAFTTSEVLPYVCTLDKASRGCGFALRFKPNKAQKEFLKGFDLIPICSAEYFESVANASKYNKGEVFEKLVTEYFGQIWEKDNVPFTKAGDLVVDGTHFQIKYEKATFINEKTLERLA